MSSVPAPAPSAAVARGTAITFAGHAASLARPLAFGLFARLHDAGALGALFLIWTTVELGARLATLGLDRGLRRWAEEDRADATAGALVVSAVVGLAVAGVLIAVLPYLVPLPDEAVGEARLAIALGLPLLATGNVALRAARGETQTAMYVLARAVVEPVLLLVAGAAASMLLTGASALLTGFLISIIGGAVVAAYTVVRAIGGARLVRALLAPHTWPLRQLVPLSVPLGLADLLQSAQGKLDLIAVALVTHDPVAIAGYAIAAELVSGFTQVRQGYDQVIAPIAAEARGRRKDLIFVLTEGLRWNAVFAMPMTAAMLVFPEQFLQLLGAAGAAAPILVFLVIGRTVETVLGPATSVITVVGRPRLALWAAAVGIAGTLAGQLGLAELGATGVAIASAGGAIASSVLATYWLARRERIAPYWPGMSSLLPLALLVLAPLVTMRAVFAEPHPAMLVSVMVVGLGIYSFAVVAQSRARRRSAASSDAGLPRAIQLAA
ncbi:MAG TPA: oligosaccharide flippase family protein [Kofleriaceae bacterium]